MSVKEVYMFCKKCLLPLETVKSLKAHTDECTGLFTPEQSATIIPHIQLQKLSEELRIERLKNAVASSILLEKLELKLDDIYTQTQKYNLPHPPPPQIPVSPTRKTKERFTHIKNIEKTTESAIEEKRQKITIELEPVGCFDKQTLIKNIEVEFSKLTRENYETIFKTILRYRKDLLAVIDPLEYSDILRSYFIRINDYLSKTVQLNSVKIRKEILKYFNTIETRLLELDNFYKLTPEYDHITWYNRGISLSKLSVAEFLPYNREKVFKRMMNYGLLTSSIMEIVRRELLNKTGFNNFVYLDISPKSSDRFSFYYLEKIDKKSRQWKLDCRLEGFATDLVDNILDYCCEMFRKYYSKIYGDNDYREKYWERHEFFLYDHQQLLQNIILLLDKHRLMKSLQNLLVEIATYTPSENDRFNLRSDDKIQQKRLAEEDRETRGQIIYHLHKLFDNLDTTEDPNRDLAGYISKYL